MWDSGLVGPARGLALKPSPAALAKPHPHSVDRSPLSRDWLPINSKDVGQNAGSSDACQAGRQERHFNGISGDHAKVNGQPHGHSILIGRR
jgi:hypothetical protein